MSILPGTSDFVIVNDSNPDTKVWDVQRGLLVANTGAGNYATWLSSGLGVGVPFNTSAISISSAASSDAGTTTTFTVPATTFGPGLSLTTGNTFNIQNTGGLYDGNQQFTVVDATHLKIAVAFAGNATGLIVGAQIVDTFADLMQTINSYNISLFQSGNFYGAPQAVSISGGNVSLANPLVELTILSNPGGTGVARTVSLPQMNVPGSIPKGVPFYIQVNTNDGAGHAPGINLLYADGTTLVTAGVAGDVIMLLVSDNSTSNGTVIPVILPFVPVQTLRGGLGTNVAPTDGQIPIGQGGNPKTYAPKTVSGDVTNDDTGAFTIKTSVNLAGSPTTTTQTAGDNSTKIATDAFVTTAVANAIAAVNPAVAVQAATNAILPNSPTYNNGVAGIGAFITTLTLNTALVIDGYTPALNDRILVKNESGGGGLGAAKNGVYVVTQIAAIGLAWILTRALDYDQPSDINNTGAIPIVNGTANASTTWVLTSAVVTVGTDALTYAEFSLNPAVLITTSTTAGGDLTGTYPNPGVGKFKGNATVAVADGGTGAAKYNACRIHLASNQTINTGADRKILYDTVDFDPDGIADITTNHRITPNVAGTFLVTLVGYASAVGITELIVSIYKTGVANATSANAATASTSEAGLCVSALIQMNGTTDYIEGFMQPQGVNSTANGISKLQNLSCVRVGP